MIVILGVSNNILHISKICDFYGVRNSHIFNILSLSAEMASIASISIKECRIYINETSVQKYRKKVIAKPSIHSFFEGHNPLPPPPYFLSIPFVSNPLFEIFF